MAAKKRLLIAVLWIACGINNWGITLGYFCGEFPRQSRRSNYGIAALMAIGGPFGTMISALLSNFAEHGYLWK
jgi:hypothetical protein